MERHQEATLPEIAGRRVGRKKVTWALVMWPFLLQMPPLDGSQSSIIIQPRIAPPPGSMLIGLISAIKVHLVEEMHRCWFDYSRSWSWFCCLYTLASVDSWIKADTIRADPDPDPDFCKNYNKIRIGWHLKWEWWNWIDIETIGADPDPDPDF